MSDTIIEKQIGLIRTILSDLALKKECGNEEFITEVQEYFGFETKFGWNILMNAFYVFEDTELAKSDFEKFGLQGPSRHKNIGEKYLRLYGILNALYQQNLAVINLMKLFKLSLKSGCIVKLRESKAIQLRNKIAAHSSNYLSDKQRKIIDVYEISRHDLDCDKIKLLRNQENFETYDLNDSILEFNQIIQDILTEILKKFIIKKYNNQGRYYNEFTKIMKLKSGSLEIGGMFLSSLQ